MLARVLLLIALTLPLPALAQLRWVEGRHYTRLAGQTAETRPGKIEVAEVFSYGCVHCYRAQADVAKLKASLPADAYMTYVHASFIPAEAWPLYQRVWYTAQAMGIGEANHPAMFSAVWESNDPVSFRDKNGGIRKTLPVIQDAARFYARVAKIKEADFLKVAKSPPVEAAITRAEFLIKSWRAGGTPSFVVNGRYLINNEVVDASQMPTVIAFLIGEERRRLAQANAVPAAPAKPAPAKP